MEDSEGMALGKEPIYDESQETSWLCYKYKLWLLCR